MITVKKNEATKALRRMEFHCVDATDGMTPETDEVGGQPQFSVNGAAWGNSAGVLVAIGNGRYYVELSQAEANIADRSTIAGRYKSANTAEALGETIQIIEYPVDASVAALPTLTGIEASTVLAMEATVEAIPDTVIEGSITLKEAHRILLAPLAGKSSGGGTSTITFKDTTDSKNRIVATVDASGNRTAITIDKS